MEPVRIIIIGATGDLAKKKLYTALYALWRQEKLPDDIDIIGCARTPHTDESFREYLRGILGDADESARFVTACRYVAGDFAAPEGYASLSRVLAQSQRCVHTLLYLAVSPDLYAPLFEHLSNSGLAIPCVQQGGITSWVRIAVEKPFGRDLRTAQALEQQLCASFSEEQIFRIDHYLAKENLENILALRFGNMLFEPIWNAQCIERVHARLFEPFGAHGRASFYDGFGALRDVGQNHLLQMLAVIAMERPASFDADGIRAARAAALAQLTCDRACGAGAVKGQYESYQSEPGVKEGSATETYFRIEARLNAGRLAGVPFILEAGKKMREHRVDITVTFKPSAAVAQNAGPGGANAIVFSIAPKETISINFLAKRAGFGFALVPKSFTFQYDDGSPDTPKDAYEKLLHDAIVGNRTLFLSNAEVEHSWRFISAIVEGWEGAAPVTYPDGSDGPVLVT